MAKENNFFTNDRKRAARHVVRGFAGGVGAAYLSVYGPIAYATLLDLGETRAQRAAFAEGRQNLSAVTKDLSHGPQNSQTRRNQEFLTGGDTPREDDAAAKARYAGGRFTRSGAPADVVKKGTDEIEAAIRRHDPDYKSAKDAVVRFDVALDPHYETLQSRQDRQEVQAAVNTALAVGPGLTWALAEGGWAVRRKRRNNRETSYSSTSPVTTHAPAMKEIPRVTGIPRHS